MAKHEQFFSTLKQHGIKNNDCILNSVTVLKRSKLCASMIVLPWMLEALKAGASAWQVCVSRATFEMNKMLQVQ